MPAILLREGFRNTEALFTYIDDHELSCNDLKQFLYQGIRRRKPEIPDHVIKNKLSKFIEPNSGSILIFLNQMLNTISDRYIEPTSNGQFLVESKLFSEWQDLITEIPPLFGICSALRDSYDIPDHNDRTQTKLYFERFIRPQVRYSALPSIKDPRLDELIERLKLDDLHIHLNGSSEIEIIWRTALCKPKAFAKELKSASNNRLVKELYSAEEVGLTQEKQLMRLNIAKSLRILLLNEVFDTESFSAEHTHSSNQKSAFKIQLVHIEQANSQVGFIDSLKVNDKYNFNYEIEAVLSDQLSHIDENIKTPLALEAFYLVAMFGYLKKTNNEAFAHALYYYLLIKCQFNRLIVQQTHQFGFDQFQKFTVNEIRSTTEKEYQTRYHQLNYSDLGDLDYLEGRFAPSRDMPSNVERLKVILADYKRYQIKEERSNNAIADRLNKVNPYSLKDLLSHKARGTSLKLSLIAHFIKRRDKHLTKLVKGEIQLSWQCRHYELRNQLEKTRRSLESLQERYIDLSDYLYGFDAAANELDAGPEVFAPVFKRLRKAGYHNFTYHAGEDYVHLLSGIRNVSEAIDFLELKTGNRIGHGTAIGINPGLWRERIGNNVVMKRGERLDDLVFAYKHFCDNEVNGTVLHLIEREIRTLSAFIYEEQYSPIELYDAWRLRAIDPILAFELKRKHDSYLRSDIKNEIDSILKLKKANKKAFEIFGKYHGVNNAECAIRYQELIEVDMTCPCERAFNYENFRILQKYVIGKINRRHMAIESLPTSNVRISFYEHYREHHIFDWLGVTDEKGMEVPVVLGSDDPGIFATNLRNEYAHILLTLENDIGLSSMDAIAKLEQIVRNGKIWRFKKLSY
ncbi:hypothetical protein [Pseudoalteromonas sp. MB47]|uniref:hypothetical protein n=1 Tax=Pseudoalteromonas sp. MB47 TaxID=2588452 RepID=UPI0014083D49|nr:hypothetical protein [Pseudoalteromonas sp. MB47]NHH87716.1 Adenosine deaminase [Pseudoalteromonas sp. MB47]